MKTADKDMLPCLLPLFPQFFGFLVTQKATPCLIVTDGGGTYKMTSRKKKKKKKKYENGPIIDQTGRYPEFFL